MGGVVGKEKAEAVVEVEVVVEEARAVAVVVKEEAEADRTVVVEAEEGEAANVVREMRAAIVVVNWVGVGGMTPFGSSTAKRNGCKCHSCHLWKLNFHNDPSCLQRKKLHHRDMCMSPPKCQHALGQIPLRGQNRLQALRPVHKIPRGKPSYLHLRDIPPVCPRGKRG